MQRYFGEPWDSPMIDEGIRIPTPVDSECGSCAEPIIEGEQGLVIPCARLGEDGEPYAGLEAFHRECWLRMILGPITHLEGNCLCYGKAEIHGHGEPSPREQGRQVAAWIEVHRGRG